MAHRYWRISGMAAQSGGAPAFAEIEMHGSVGGANLIGGGTPAASTSYNSSYLPGNAVDGNASTMWSAALGDTTAAWWSYDFGAGAAVQVVEVRLLGRNDGVYTYAPSGFTLQYSDDNAAWTTVATFACATWTSNGQVQTFRIAHRYWRLGSIAGQSGNFSSIAEIGMHGSIGGANLYNGGTAAASTSYSSSYLPGNAIDGDGSTLWSSGASDTTAAWWSYDFGAGTFVQVVEVRLLGRNDSNYAYAPASFTLQWSDDNTTWTTVASFTCATWTSAAQVQTFSYGATAIPDTNVHWSGPDRSVAITLTNQYLTASGSTAAGLNGTSWFSVRATRTQTTGKYYCEFTVNSNGSSGGSNGSLSVGVLAATASVSGLAGSNSSTLAGANYWPWSGLTYINGSTGTIQSSTTAGIVVCMAVDLTARKIWWRIGAGNWNNDTITNQNPATGAGGLALGFAGACAPDFCVDYPSVGVTANFGDTTYAQTVPTGYNNWGYTPAIPPAPWRDPWAGRRLLAATEDDPTEDDGRYLRLRERRFFPTKPGLLVSKSLQYVVVGDAPGISVSKSLQYVVLGDAPGISVSKSVQYLVVLANGLPSDSQRRARDRQRMAGYEAIETEADGDPLNALRRLVRTKIEPPGPARLTQAFTLSWVFAPGLNPTVATAVETRAWIQETPGSARMTTVGAVVWFTPLNTTTIGIGTRFGATTWLSTTPPGTPAGATSLLANAWLATRLSDNAARATEVSAISWVTVLDPTLRVRLSDVLTSVFYTARAVDDAAAATRVSTLVWLVARPPVPAMRAWRQRPEEEEDPAPWRPRRTGDGVPRVATVAPFLARARPVWLASRDTDPEEIPWRRPRHDGGIFNAGLPPAVIASLLSRVRAIRVDEEDHEVAARFKPGHIVAVLADESAGARVIWLM